MTGEPTSSFARALDARLDGLRTSPAYAAYWRARNAVMEMLSASADAGTDAPSEYWTEELAGFDYMLDASPLIVAKLRQHTYHITGLKPYDYRTGKDGAALARKIAMLEKVAGGRDLLVPEAPDLGGFGFEIDGALYNVDTLKFWEVLIALDKGGVLGGLRTPGGDARPVVWEIGAGWGGFAHALKTLIPNVTYLIVDLPEVMLFSGTYLQAMFPDAKLHFHTPATPVTEAAWREADFILVPHTALDDIRPPRLDLALNMVSFQEMTAGQVAAYVDAAWEWNAPFLYSLNRDRSPYNTEIESVSDLIARRFWPHEVPVLDIPYTRMPDAEQAEGAKAAEPVRKREKAREKPKKRKDTAYRHIVGWRRTGE